MSSVITKSIFGFKPSQVSRSPLSWPRIDYRLPLVSAFILGLIYSLSYLPFEIFLNALAVIGSATAGLFLLFSGASLLGAFVILPVALFVRYIRDENDFAVEQNNFDLDKEEKGFSKCQWSNAA